jgi:hypothetical protein
MMITNDNLRIWLTFPNELNRVEVVAATNRSYGQRCFMGVVEGRERLEDLLDEAGIDHYIVSSGEPLTDGFCATAFERSPKQITDGLEESFNRSDEIPLKILRGNVVSDEERSFTPPKSLHLYSSSFRTDEGANRIAAWFNARKI